jgi:hypothetical protein
MLSSEMVYSLWSVTGCVTHKVVGIVISRARRYGPLGMACPIPPLTSSGVPRHATPSGFGWDGEGDGEGGGGGGNLAVLLSSLSRP